MAAGPELRRERRRRPALAAQRQRGIDRVRPGGAAGRRLAAQYGAIPPAGAHIRVRRYRTGGGRVGNVGAHEIVTLKSAIPFIGRVDNRRPAVGGVDGETLEAAKTRGPLVLGTRNRAVTARDYEQLAREATPEVARVRCLPVDEAGRPAADAGAAAGVRVLIVPAVAADEAGRLHVRAARAVRADDGDGPRVPRRAADGRRPRRRHAAALPRRDGGDPRCGPGSRADPDELRGDARSTRCTATSTRCDGGPDGDGWAFGRPILLGEVFGVAQRVEGVDLIEDARMFPADPISGQRGEAITRIDLDPDSLVFSYGHQVQVVTRDARGRSTTCRRRSPLASFLPAMLQADDFCVRFTQGLDPVLAPVLSTIDNLDAYVDPWLTPPDFLDWLAGWFGLELDATWPEERRRALVANALELGRWRGTVVGLALLVELYTGEGAEIDDGGGVASRRTTRTRRCRVAPRGRVTVRYRPGDGVDEDRLDAARPRRRPGPPVRALRGHRSAMMERFGLDMSDGARHDGARR